MSGFVERFPFLLRTLSDLEQPLTQTIPHGTRGSCLVRLGCGFSFFFFFKKREASCPLSQIIVTGSNSVRNVCKSYRVQSNTG